MQIDMDPNRTTRRTLSRKHEWALETACDLNYSRAIDILRSSGPPSEPPDDLFRKLQQLHPQEDLNKYHCQKSMHLFPTWNPS